MANYVAARDPLALDTVREAVELLGRATKTLPEFGEAHWILSRQLLRVGRDDDAFGASILAIVTPPCWGGASSQAMSFKRQRSCRLVTPMTPCRFGLRNRFCSGWMENSCVQ